MERVERYLEQILRAGLRRADRSLIEAPTFARNLRATINTQSNFEKILGALAFGALALNVIEPQTSDYTFPLWTLGGSIYFGFASARMKTLK